MVFKRESTTVPCATERDLIAIANDSLACYKYFKKGACCFITSKIEGDPDRCSSIAKLHIQALLRVVDRKKCGI